MIQFMDKNNDALAAAYGLILEGKDGTVGKDMSGKSFEGSEKASPKDNPFKNAEETQKKKPEGPSQGETTVADGKGKPAPKSKDIPKKKVSESGIPTTFDKLYNAILNEEGTFEKEDIAPAGDVEDENFDEDAGDFGEGNAEAGETGEMGEFDVATAFRELADSISAIADKLSGMGDTSTENPLGGEGEADLGADLGGEGEVGGDLEKKPFGESVSVGKIPAPTTPKVAKKTSFNPKMTKNPKNNVGKSGAGKAGLPAAGKDRSGTLSKAPATQFSPKMSQTVGGTGPAAKGGNESFIK